MGSIPLPALDYHPPQQPDQLQQLGRLMALKQAVQNAPLEHQALQQQVQSGANSLQIQQQQIKDQQGIANWYRNINPNDPNALDPGNVGKALANSGVSGTGILKVQGDILQHRQLAATLTKDQIANRQEISNNLYNGVNGIIGETDPTKRAQALVPLINLAAQNGIIQQPQAQQMLANPGAVTDDQLKQFQHGLGVSAAFLRAAAAQQQAKYKVVDGTLYDMSGETPKPALAGTLDPARWNAIVDSIVPKGAGNDALNARTHSTVDFYLKNGNATGAQQALAAAAQQVGSIEKETNPAALKAKEDVAAVEGNSRASAYANLREYPVYDAQLKQTVYMTPSELNRARVNDPLRYSVPSYSPGALGQKDATNYFIKGKGGQQLTAFNTALNHLDTLDSLASALGNSNIQVFNRAAQAWAEQTGNPAPTNFAAAKNAMAGEVASALKASGATDDEINKVDQTFKRAQGPMQLKGAIATYRTLLRSKAHNLHQQYQQGMQGLPNFQPQENGGNSGGSGFFSKFGGQAH